MMTSTSHARLLLLLVSVAEAHRSLPAGITCGSQFNASAPLNIPNPKISWASYHIHTCDHPVFWLDGAFTKDQLIAFTVGVPRLTRFKDVRMTTVLLGPGLPLTADTIDPNGSKMIPKQVIDEMRSSGLRAQIFESPEDQSNCNHMNKVMKDSTKIDDGRCLFHEEFGGSYSWVLADIEAKTAQHGTYKFAIFNKAGTATKAWFACCDWPEDFTTKYEIPASTCPFCGSHPDKNGAWASLFYEQKSMSNFKGFPAVNACPVRDQKPQASQCPPEAKSKTEQGANCVLHCSNGNCHSHNVDGGCVFDIDWKIPYPTLPSTGAVVKKIVLFKGDSVRIKKADQFAHNIYAFNTVDDAMQCNFKASKEIAMTEETGIGFTVDFDRLTQSGLGKDNEFAFSCSIMCTNGRNTDPGCHCVKGQRLVVKVKDPADGRRCHSHDYTMPAPPAGPDPCPGSNVRRAIESKMFKSGNGECTQMCVPTAALQWVSGMTEAGTCHEAGYYADAANPKQTVQFNQNAPPMDLLIKAKPSTEPCHCHSYEEILCSAAGDDLYNEHIDEITKYCAGVVAGTDKICPYNCFQPFEVLHLHYLSCKYRAPDALFLKVQNTEICHLATRSKDGSECVTTTAAAVLTVESTAVTSAINFAVSAMIIMFTTFGLH